MDSYNLSGMKQSETVESGEVADVVFGDDQKINLDRPSVNTLCETAVVRRVCLVVWGDGGESRLLPD